MDTQRIGILHPGEMGISVAASAQHSGARVYWASEGRGAQTRARADKHRLTDSQTVAALCRECDVIISVCPPHAAEAVAQEVAARGFRGLYVDANAIAPDRAQRIGILVQAAGATFVDGGIIGGPAWEQGKTCLYLSGPNAEAVTACFAAGPLAIRVLGPVIGAASALKMCYAAHSKGMTALLCATLAAAERLGVREALQAQWARDDAAFAERTAQRVRAATAKAWRFVGEMEEIAATFRAAGLPGEFHDGAAIVYRRLEQFKSAAAAPEVATALAALVPEVKSSSGIPPASNLANDLQEERWDLRREGRAWRGPEVMARYELVPEKIELIEGKLFWSEEDRLTMLALLLENVGVDSAVRLGDPQVWRDAVARLHAPDH